jgi:ABC-type glycerol-3-phosphate transport system substrate-binding protein
MLVEIMAEPTIVQPPQNPSFTPPPPPPPVGGFNPPQPPTSPNGPEPVVSANPRNGIPRPLIIAIILVLVLLVGIVVFKLVLPRFQSSTPKEENLVWWGLWEDEGVVSPLIAEYQAAHPAVKIQYVKQSKEDYRERLTNALAKGPGQGAPDIFMFHNSWVPMFKSDLGSIPDTIYNPADYAKDFFPIATSDLRTSSGIVGIPLGFDALGLYINDDIFQSYGKTAPKTWDELRQTALDLTIRDENGVIKQAGVALGRTENVDHWPEILGLMMLQNGVDLTNPTGVNAEAALSFYTIFSKTDKVWDETLPNSTAAFAGGKLAMYLAPSWRIFEIKQLNPSLKFSVVPVPQLPKETQTEPNVNYGTYWANGVYARSSSAPAAWEFLKFMSTKESLTKLYQNETNARGIGEAYPRQDMVSLLSSDPMMGAFVNQGQDARSWYLQTRTFDGPTGINTQIDKYFEDAINGVNQNTQSPQALQTAAQGVAQVLSQYGLISAPVPTP